MMTNPIGAFIQAAGSAQLAAQHGGNRRQSQPLDIVVLFAMHTSRLHRPVLHLRDELFRATGINVVAAHETVPVNTLIVMAAKSGQRLDDLLTGFLLDQLLEGKAWAQTPAFNSPLVINKLMHGGVRVRFAAYAEVSNMKA